MWYNNNNESCSNSVLQEENHHEILSSSSTSSLHRFSISIAKNHTLSSLFSSSLRSSTRIIPLDDTNYEGGDDHQNYCSEQRIKIDEVSKEDEKDGDAEDNKNSSSSSSRLPIEEWLPITESRKGNIYYCIFHLLSSGIGLQPLALLPIAFTTLGWVWGSTWLSIAFIWQLYTIWLLVHLHESSSGRRFSRYVMLAIAAFGPKLGKLLAIFPVMYLSGGACVILVIQGGGTMQNLHKILCQDDNSCHTNSPTTVQWYLIFICLAIVIAQLPNLNSIAWISLVGAITGLVYCTVIWIFSIKEGRPSGTVHYTATVETSGNQFMSVMYAMGIVCFCFKGHNVVLEIQGTLPANDKEPIHKTMWRGVTISYTLIALCIFPLAIAGYWAYGSTVLKIGILQAFAQHHGNHKVSLATIYFLLIINSLSSFQIFVMPVFDNLELRYVSFSHKPCTWWLRAGIRVFFGGFAFFVSVAVPFLPLLAPLVGAMALPLTFAYPSFMWILIKKPKPFGSMWWINLVLGCLAILLSILLVSAAIWHYVTVGLKANFFHPKP